MAGKFDNIKEEVWSHFRDFQFVFLTTSEGDQPRVRPITLIYLDGKFWITTGTNNAKAEQIRKNPKIEFCLLLEKGDKRGYVRAAGVAKIIQDRETKVRIAKHCDFFSEHWKDPDDPNYTLIEFSISELEYLRPDETTARKFIL